MEQTNLVDLSSNLYDALNQLPPNSVALNKTVLPYFLYKKGKKHLDYYTKFWMEGNV